MSEGAPERLVGDRYRVIRELGRGGMGVVYLGRDLRLDMDVALKFRGVAHADATLWLKREFRAVSSLRHPNLVELYELVRTRRPAPSAWSICRAWIRVGGWSDAWIASRRHG